MLKKRVIPKILISTEVSNKQVEDIAVTTHCYNQREVVGLPLSLAKIYEAQNADELIITSINNRDIRSSPSLLKLIEKMAGETFMPLTVGGGVRDVDTFSVLLGVGADKVSISSCCAVDGFIEQAARKHGQQCVVACVDYRWSGDDYIVCWPLNGDNYFKKDLKVNDWCCELEKRGVGEIILTNTDLDGTMKGLHLEMLAEVRKSLDIPIIASGGVGKSKHILECFQQTDVDGVAAATFFCRQDQNVMQTKSFVSNGGIPIRI